MFIVSADGKELASTLTDDEGRAYFTPLNQDSTAKYILVDADGYFIGGTRWIEGLRDYFIILATATLR